jgi:hypothetical protein
LEKLGRYLEQIISGQFTQVGDNVIPIRKSL